MNPRVALITGASSGIGRACAAHLAARGILVYGTSRAPSSGTMLQMDVTDDASIQRAIDSIVQREGPPGHCGEQRGHRHRRAPGTHVHR